MKNPIVEFPPKYIMNGKNENTIIIIVGYTFVGFMTYISFAGHLVVVREVTHTLKGSLKEICRLPVMGPCYLEVIFECSVLLAGHASI